MKRKQKKKIAALSAALRCSPFFAQCQIYEVVSIYSLRYLFRIGEWKMHVVC